MCRDTTGLLVCLLAGALGCGRPDLPTPTPSPSGGKTDTTESQRVECSTPEECCKSAAPELQDYCQNEWREFLRCQAAKRTSGQCP
jgi:hypothetical protein